MEKNFVCKFCNKKFPSGKSLGGHIRIHTNENSVCYNGKRRVLCCRECGKGFDSLKALSAHMDCHSEREKIVMDNQSDTEASSSPTRKRFNKVMKLSNSESFSDGSLSSASEIDQEDKDGAFNLMVLSRDSTFKKGRNSLAESSDNNSVVLETKSSSGEQLKMFNVKSEVYDQLRSTDDDDGNGVTLSDSEDSSGSDYFMDGPKSSDSDISIDGSLKNSGLGSGFNNSLNRFRDNHDELRKIKKVLRCYETSAHNLETDSCAYTNSKINRKSPMVKKAGSGEKKKSKTHKCPICSKVFKSGQAMGGHKRSHFIGLHLEHRPLVIQDRVAAYEMHSRIDLNLPALDIDE